MTTEEELKDLRQQFKERVKRDRLERRVNTIVFGIISVVGLVALVYGFFQQTSAKKEQIVAKMTRVISDKEIAVLRKQILVLKEESLACEKSLAELQAAKAKPGK